MLLTDAIAGMQAEAQAHYICCSFSGNKARMPNKDASSGDEGKPDACQPNTAAVQQDRDPCKQAGTGLPASDSEATAGRQQALQPVTAAEQAPATAMPADQSLPAGVELPDISGLLSVEQSSALYTHACDVTEWIDQKTAVLESMPRQAGRASCVKQATPKATAYRKGLDISRRALQMSADNCDGAVFWAVSCFCPSAMDSRLPELMFNGDHIFQEHGHESPNAAWSCFLGHLKGHTDQDRLIAAASGMEGITLHGAFSKLRNQMQLIKMALLAVHKAEEALSSLETLINACPAASEESKSSRQNPSASI